MPGRRVSPQPLKRRPGGQAWAGPPPCSQNAHQEQPWAAQRPPEGEPWTRHFEYPSKCRVDGSAGAPGWVEAICSHVLDTFLTLTCSQLAVDFFFRVFSELTNAHKSTLFQVFYDFFMEKSTNSLKKVDFGMFEKVDLGMFQSRKKVEN